MVRFMERCTVDGLQLYLASDQTAVGAQVDIRHLAPTPSAWKSLSPVRW